MHNAVWYKLECLQIQRAVVNVYQKLGRNLAEADYRQELSAEFNKLGIPFSNYQPSVSVGKQAHTLTHSLPHFICHGVIAVKINVLPTTQHEHIARASNFLKTSKSRLAILANFGAQPNATVELITR